SAKPWMPCLSARLPVAIEFHSTGERMGCKVARLPITPWLMRSSSAGIKPCSSRGVATFQSAASQPISRTFLARGAVILDFPLRILECGSLLPLSSRELAREGFGRGSGASKPAEKSELSARRDLVRTPSACTCTQQLWSAAACCRFVAASLLAEDSGSG